MLPWLLIDALDVNHFGMDRIDKINKVNAVLADYFANRANSEIVAAKDLMPLFIKNGIF